jgi:hypothetical protein
MGQALPGDRPGLAPSLGACHSFFAFAPGIRKMIYTTNAVEALHRSLRKMTRKAQTLTGWRCGGFFQSHGRFRSAQ